MIWINDTIWVTTRTAWVPLDRNKDREYIDGVIYYSRSFYDPLPPPPSSDESGASTDDRTDGIGGS